jgi:hypothetical protein
LRSKHALKPSLDKYSGLFRDTLEVPNDTMDMLITDLLSLGSTILQDNSEYQYRKELLIEIARRLRQDDGELKRLDKKACWPCRTRTGRRILGSLGTFYVNDRQDLFEIFADKYTLLDFDFTTTKKIADLLRIQGCKSFLSDLVLKKTESCEPLEYDHGLTQDFQGRADALVKCVMSFSDSMSRFLTLA